MRYNFIQNNFTDLDKNTNKLAISGSDFDISWAELYTNVNKLEEIFLGLEIPKGHPVMIYGHKESFYAQSILALIKSDIPYVPIDEIYPIERIEKIKAITGSQILINCSDKDIATDFPIVINKNFTIVKNSKPLFANHIYYNPTNPLRYIMFTSGSTGEPKGVQISKNNILSFLDWIEKDYKYTHNDVFMNQSPFTFDVSLYDILSSFMLGASVILISRKLASNSEEFLNKLKNYNVSIWTSTPSFSYIYLREKQYNLSFLPKLKTFVFAGEVLSRKIIVALHKKFENPRIINAYGPTEATITTTWIDLSPNTLSELDKIPIGYPKRDSEIIIETEEDKEEGEIIIVGEHVSDGYFKNDELTKSKFFKHNNKQAFRTGDLGYITDGIVYYTGRNDDLIKFHGYRIELGEIDTAINNIDFIDETVTIALKRNDEIKRIISFVILKDTSFINDFKQKIISIIETKVPSYMIPGDIVSIKQFPVNANHKIDRKKLIEIYSKS